MIADFGPTPSPSTAPSTLRVSLHLYAHSQPHFTCYRPLDPSALLVKTHSILRATLSDQMTRRENFPFYDSEDIPQGRYLCHHMSPYTGFTPGLDVRGLKQIHPLYPGRTSSVSLFPMCPCQTLLHGRWPRGLPRRRMYVLLWLPNIRTSAA